MAGKGNAAHGIGAIALGAFAILGRAGDDCLKSARHLDDFGAVAVGARSVDDVGAASALRHLDEGSARWAVGGDGAHGVRARPLLGEGVSVDAVDGLELTLQVVDLSDAAYWLAAGEEEELTSAEAFAQEAAARPEDQWGVPIDNMPDVTGTWCASVVRGSGEEAVEIFERVAIEAAQDNTYRYESMIRASGTAAGFQTGEAFGVVSVRPGFWVTSQVSFDVTLPDGGVEPSGVWRGPITSSRGSAKGYQPTMAKLVAYEPTRIALAWDNAVVPVVRCD
jgi:hypothetical protein